MKTSINLRKSNLMEYKDWSASAKAYLESAPEEIPLDEVCDSYYQLVREFRVWMQNCLIELHADELAWLAEKREELKQMLKGHF